MKRLISIIILVSFAITSCRPSDEVRSSQTSMALSETSSSWTDTPTSTRTSTTTPTSLPTLTRTPTPTPTLDPNIYISQSACDLPFYPLRTGSTSGIVFLYMVGGGYRTWPIEKTIEVTGNMAYASAFVTKDLGEETGWTETTYTCDSNGIVLTDLISFGFRGPNMPLRTSLVSSSGLYFPPADQWRVGYTWEYCMETRLDGGVGYTEYQGLDKDCRSVTISSAEMVEYEGKIVEALRLVTEGGEEGEEFNYSSLYAYGIGEISPDN